jgi:hypothetical protein
MSIQVRAFAFPEKLRQRKLAKELRACLHISYAAPLLVTAKECLWTSISTKFEELFEEVSGRQARRAPLASSWAFSALKLHDRPQLALSNICTARLGLFAPTPPRVALRTRIKNLLIKFSVGINKSVSARFQFTDSAGGFTPLMITREKAVRAV